MNAILILCKIDGFVSAAAWMFVNRIELQMTATFQSIWIRDRKALTNLIEDLHMISDGHMIE